MPSNFLNFDTTKTDNLSKGERVVGRRKERLNASVALNQAKEYRRSVEGQHRALIQRRRDAGKVPTLLNDLLQSPIFGTTQTVSPRQVENNITNNSGVRLDAITDGRKAINDLVKSKGIQEGMAQSKSSVKNVRMLKNRIINQRRRGTDAISNLALLAQKDHINQTAKTARMDAFRAKVKLNTDLSYNKNRYKIQKSVGQASNRNIGALYRLENRGDGGMVSAPTRHGSYFTRRNKISKKKKRAIDIDSEMAGYLAMPIHLDDTKIRTVGVAHMDQAVPLNLGRPQPVVRDKRETDITYLTEDLDKIMDTFLELYTSGESYAKLKSRSLLFSVFAESMKSYMKICEGAVVECRKALRPVRRTYPRYNADKNFVYGSANGGVAKEIRNKILTTGTKRSNTLERKLEKMGAEIPSEVQCNPITDVKVFTSIGSLECVDPDILSPIQDTYKIARNALQRDSATKYVTVMSHTDKNVMAIRSIYGDVLIKRNILLYTYLDGLTDTLLHRNPNIPLHPLVQREIVSKDGNPLNAYRHRFEKFGGWSHASYKKGVSRKYSEPDVRDKYWRPSLRSFGKKGVDMSWIQFLREIYDWKRLTNVRTVASLMYDNTSAQRNDIRKDLRLIQSRLGGNLGVTEYGYAITKLQLVNPLNVVPWTPSYHKFGRSWYVSDYSESDEFQLPFGGYNEYSAPSDERQNQGLSGEALDIYLNQALTNICQVEKGSKGRYTHIRTGGISKMGHPKLIQLFTKLRSYSIGSKTFTAPIVWQEGELTVNSIPGVKYMGPSLQWSILNAVGLVAGTRHNKWNTIIDIIERTPLANSTISTVNASELARKIEQESAKLYVNNINSVDSSIPIIQYPSNLLNRKYKAKGTALVKTVKGSRPGGMFYPNLVDAKVSKRSVYLTGSRNAMQKARVSAHDVGQGGLIEIGLGLCADPRAPCANVRKNANSRNTSHEIDEKSLAENTFLIDSQIFCDVDSTQAFYAHYAGNSTITDSEYTEKSNRVPCRLPVNTSVRGGQAQLQRGRSAVQVLQGDARSGLPGLISRIKENVLIPLFKGNQIISYYHFDDLMKRFLITTAPYRSNSKTSAIELNKLMDRPDMIDLMESLQYYLLIYIGESPIKAAERVVRLTRFRKFNQSEIAKYETTRMLRVLGDAGIMSKPVFTKVMTQLIASHNRKDGLTLLQVDTEIAKLKANLQEKPGFLEKIKRKIINGLGGQGIMMGRNRWITERSRNMGTTTSEGNRLGQDLMRNIGPRGARLSKIG